MVLLFFTIDCNERVDFQVSLTMPPTNSEKNVILHTGIKVPPLYWNKAQQCITNNLPVKFGVTANLNKDLLRMFSVASALVLKAKTFKIGATSNLAKLRQGFSPIVELCRPYKNGDLTQRLSTRHKLNILQ